MTEKFMNLMNKPQSPKEYNKKMPRTSKCQGLQNDP